MHSTIFGRSPFLLVVVWMLVSLAGFVLAMNVKHPGAMMIGSRWIFGALALYCVCDVVYRLNRAQWR